MNYHHELREYLLKTEFNIYLYFADMNLSLT